MAGDRVSRIADGRAHLSIGEVLSLLQEEFPDVTISKIRFLESQGLLDPERTPSGYRKFYDDDIDRLRWILRQQREHFLPLKVIKDRLAAGELDEAPVDGVDESFADADSDTTVPADGRRSMFELGESSVSLSAEELAGLAGLTTRQVTELRQYGLLEPRRLGTLEYFDDDAVVVARVAADFLALGVEPRHLRQWKVAAEREAGFYEQLVMPRLHQRRPGARAEAMELLDEAAGLGEALRSALLRRALRDALRPS